MEKVELVFVPAPLVGHIVSIVEFAKLLLHRDSRKSITVLVMKNPLDPVSNSTVESVLSGDNRIRHVNLPEIAPPPPELLLKTSEKYISSYIESHCNNFRNALASFNTIAGVVFDMFCSSVVEVANEIGVDSYLFYTCSAGFLGFNLYLPIRGGGEYSLSSPDSVVSTFKSPVPAKVMPNMAFIDEGYRSFVYHGQKFKDTKGIIINTFAELEPYAIKSLVLDLDLPPIYTVGPMLAPQEHRAGKEEILCWLSSQPPSTVVFLCFGSQGGFEPPQIHQIAAALENSGQRFLWSIRRPHSLTKAEIAREFSNFELILPEGFIERTKNWARICGWAPQVEVLRHRATAAFVTHCGWNSVLESVCHGVLMVAWPIYAEQQLNAFELVNELGLAVELTLDYRRMQDSGNRLIMADEIESALRAVMDPKNPVREKVKEMGKISREVLMDGGSSFVSFNRLIKDIIDKTLK